MTDQVSEIQTPPGENTRRAAVDGVTLGVIEGTLEAAVRAMREVLVRSARSPIISIATDFSNAIFNARGEQVAQGEDQPVHLGSMSVALGCVIDYFDGDFAAGDVIYVNDPVQGGGHLVDMAMFKPVFDDQMLIGWVGNRSHVSDGGGSVSGGFNPIARQIYEEGLRIPPIKLFDAGRRRSDVFKLITANLRTARAHRGDMAAQMGALEIAEVRLASLVERYGVTTLLEAMDALLDRGERLGAEALAALPEGTYRSRTYAEEPDGGEELWIDCELTLSDGEARVVLAASPQVERYVNSYFGNTISAVYAGVFTVLPSNMPHNGGVYRRIKVELGPLGTIVNAAEPAPCSMSTGTPFDNVTEAVEMAIAQAAPERAVAAWAHFCGLTFAGVDSRSGERFSFVSSMAGMGGAGSMWQVDGWSCCSPQCAAGGSRSGNVEEIELRVPLRIHRFELEPDSEGPGTWRGGFGCAFEVEILERSCEVSNIGEGFVRPPAGALGGGSALHPFRRSVTLADGEVREIEPHSQVRLSRGDVLRQSSPGGGGVGNPRERGADKVAADVRNDLISAERARSVYGWEDS
jgi:N-methylhydantoinase B